jgi:hypothetical protein
MFKLLFFTSKPAFAANPVLPAKTVTENQTFV